METKDKILLTALTLFNHRGYGSVSMKDIADELGVDRRNISYHYNKEGLLKALTNQMWSELELARKQKKDFPSFENLDREVVLYNQLQNSYAFVFKDLYVMRHPLIQKKFESFCQTMVSDCQQAVAFAIQQGNMIAENKPGTYNALCESIWAISISWLQLQSFRGIQDLDQCRRLIWSLIVPYFTEKGVNAFKSYFGHELYNSLGQAFDVKVNTVLF